MFMSCTTHKEHDHKHDASCGHKAIKHDEHTDYLHDGHLHHVHGDHVDEHILAENAKNESACTPEHKCSGHESSHSHGPTCGHDAIPHGDHVDYLVEGHLHKPCGDHCDAHGELATA
jgi:hypothetical protein